MSTRDKLSGIILQVLFVLIPIQIGYHFWPEWAYIFGIRVDYFSPTVYFTDILIILFCFLRTKEEWKLFSKIKPKYLIAVGLFIILNIYFAFNQPVAIYKWIKLLEFTFLFLGLKTFSEKRIKELIYKPTVIALVIFSLLGIAQFFRGQTLNGVFYFLGERTFNAATPGIALVDLFGKSYLRAYSTFPHPNAFAGYLIVSSLLLMWSRRHSKLDVVGWLTILISSAAFLCTFSLAAFVCVVFIFTFYISYRGNYAKFIQLLLLLMIVFSMFSTTLKFGFLGHTLKTDGSVSERLELNIAAGKIFTRYPFFGAGLGGYVSLLPTVGGSTSFYWMLQPVHNIFLLTLSETGMVGLLALAGVFLKTIRQRKEPRVLLLALITILVTGSLDHYWLNLQQNQILLTTLLALFFI